MASVNKVIIVGNLGKDPETRTFPSGDQVTNVSIATTDRWKDKQSGEMKEATEWHRVSFFGRLAEVAAEYLRKGSQVYVEGSLRTRKYQQDGVDKYATEIRAEEMKMLGSRPDGDGRGDGGGYGGGDRQQSRGNGNQQRQQAPARGNGRSQGGNSQGGRDQYSAGNQQRGAAKPSSGFDDMDDDIPF